jgi:hypothetical protein
MNKITLKNIKNIVKKDTKYVFLPLLVFAVSLHLGNIVSRTFAEQSGSSPDSGGATSVLVGGYNLLVSKGTNYGSSSSPDWTNDWGTYWNRIMYSATWEPDGTATANDVLSGKTFYAGSANRTIKTGTLPSNTVDYSLEQYAAIEDGDSGDYEGEEGAWTNTNTTSGSEVWYDTRTGLYWSRSEPATTNDFTISSCDFFTTDPRGDYDGSDSDCGNAINACADLSLPANEGESDDTDWYLPSQKEMIEAYNDGIANQTESPFKYQIGADWGWSSTEDSQDSTYAWKSFLSKGRMYGGSLKASSSNSVFCVRRD